MDYDYSNLVKKTQAWTNQAHILNWINNDIITQLRELDTPTSETLFSTDDIESRPLIVAFMGGTGVGKSTLLNRLAGKAIAKAGVERPTSREVTLFHHQKITIQQLPNSLPLDATNICQHHDDLQKNIVWIDMPDFDSTESSNKKLVQQWLPHIDVLIYVVSPERYKDQKAWQLLLSEGSQHAWLFVLNQWDRGQQEQYNDFNQQLHKAGFVKPIIFKTDCVNYPQSDEFSALEDYITSLSTTHIINQLEQHGTQARKLDLRQQLISIKSSLGTSQTVQKTLDLWHTQWLLTNKLLKEGLAWPMQNLAAYSAEHATDVIKPETSPYSSLWDNWAESRFDDALNEFIITIDQLEIPVSPFKRNLQSIRKNAPIIIETQTELATRLALINPGNVLQRTFLKGTRLCELILPILAMTWVGYKVFMGYYTSNLLENHYLGIDFAIHSVLLISLTWLIPFFILKKAQPSLKTSALKGLHKGLQRALNIIESDVSFGISTIIEQHKAQLNELSALIDLCNTNTLDQNLSIKSDSPLVRMLMK
ncbi:MAG: GTP-binding protein [Methylococcales bacterium]|jgi:GTP-binding protein EngB required for normal cell division|nr:MAG: GTP-binding protein [Methylococcales bacterium]